MKTATRLTLTRDEMIEKMLASDPAENGRFIVGVRTTGIYCLPSCRPPRKPKPENVEFYATPEEARAAGLRACKLCRPDDHYLGQHAGETLVEGLVAGIALDPGAYRNAGNLAAAAGVSQTKLHELFRAHYHTTPAELLARVRVATARRMLLHGTRPVAEIAFEAGFESLSAFNENFRKYTATTPARFRRLLEEPSFELTLPEDYPLARILTYLGRDRNSLTERIDGQTCTIAWRVGDEPALVRITFEDSLARCEVVVPSGPGPELIEELHGRVLATLGLTVDPLRFEAQVLGSPELAPLIDGQRGLRVPLIADPFDGLTWAIVGQQINLPFAYLLRRRLIELTGEPVGEGLYAPPSAETVAGLESEALLPLSFSRAKAGYLIGAARSVVDGRLPLDALAGSSATRIERTLLAVRGIGPWSAHYLMMRHYGFLDCVPVGDTGLTSGLKQFFALDERPGRVETLALMGRFSPYRSLASFHLWQRHGAVA
ncbi:MAG: helix-turn-helix domain-containing protein [Vicinamibacterales bacterium]